MFRQTQKFIGVAALIALLVAGLQFTLPNVQVVHAATTWLVDSAQDIDHGYAKGTCTPGQCTLRDAITQANYDAGDIIHFAGGMTITLAPSLFWLRIYAPMTIDTQNQAVTIDAASQFAIMTITGSGYIINIMGITFQHGVSNSGGALYIGGSGALNIVTLKNCTFSNNSANNGGAISNNSALTIDSSSFTNNSDTGSGGAIISAGALTLSNTSLSSNRATSASSYGGAIYLVQNSDLQILNVDGTVTFSGNIAEYGGAISANSTATGPGFSITGATFSRNLATLAGGAIYIFSYYGKIAASTFTLNQATDLNFGRGGAIENRHYSG